MNIHPLTPIEYDIIVEICRLLAARGDGSPAVQDAISILGSWGDTLPEEEVLAALQAINNQGGKRLWPPR